MRISLAVALWLNWVGATHLEAQTSHGLDDLSYESLEYEDEGEGDTYLDLSMRRRKKAPGQLRQNCKFNLNRIDGPTNTMEAFIEGNHGNTYWKDISFPSNRKSIAWRKKFGRTTISPKIFKRYKWKRLKEVLKNETNKEFSLWGPTGQPKPTHVKQGQLGVCGFLAACSKLAQHPDYIMNHLFTKWEDSIQGGVYRLNFWVRDRWVAVNVNDEFPVKKRNGQLLFASESKDGDNAWWMPILEKAYAKLYVNYERIQGQFGSETFRTLTGAPSRLFVHHENRTNFDKEYFKSMYRYFIDKGYLVSGDPSPEARERTNIVANHGYSLLDIVDLKDPAGNVAHTLCKIRNPWATTLYKGPWNDKDDSKWTDDYKEQVGGLNPKDGIFFMDFDQWMEDFFQTFVGMLDKDLFANMFIEQIKNTGTVQYYEFINPVAQKVEIVIEDYTHFLYPRKSCLKPRQGAIMLQDEQENLLDRDWYWDNVQANVGSRHEDLPPGKYLVQMYNFKFEDHPTEEYAMQFFSNKEKVKFNGKLKMY